MTDLVIPYRITSNTQELRYCLRSIDQYLTGVGHVYLIGDKPDWVHNVFHVKHSDHPDWRFKERNIHLKILAACDEPTVSDPFLFMNDDHFLLEKTDAGTFPYLYGAALQQGKYRDTTLRNTWGILGSWAFFDIHCPILFEKKLYADTLSRLNWDKPYGYSTKSVYCAMNGIQGQFVEDRKLRIPGQRPEGTWFSTSDKSFTESIMQKLYPEKSKYER